MRRVFLILGLVLGVWLRASPAGALQLSGGLGAFSGTGVNNRYALFDGTGTLEAGLLSDDGSTVLLTSGQLLLPDGTGVLPSIAPSSNPDTGIFFTGSQIQISTDTTLVWIFTSTEFRSNTTSGAQLRRTASSATVPAHTYVGDTNTGGGRAAADTPAIIGGGVPLAVFGTTVELTNANIKALNATPITLIAAQGVNTITEIQSAIIILDFGSEVLTESADNLVIEYANGTDTTGAIEATGFIDSAADDTIYAVNSLTTDQDMTALINQGVRILNTGDGEYAGNASNDTTMTVKITYRVHATGL